MLKQALKIYCLSNSKIKSSRKLTFNAARIWPKWLLRCWRISQSCSLRIIYYLTTLWVFYRRESKSCISYGKS